MLRIRTFKAIFLVFLCVTKLLLDKKDITAKVIKNIPIEKTLIFNIYPSMILILLKVGGILI